MARAAQFRLKDRNGNVHSLEDCESEYLVLYFYPKDNTPGCTLEAVEFSAKLKQFKKLGAEVIGISGGDEKSKTKFCEKHDLKVLLLSDPDFTVSKKYKVYGEKKFMGRTFNGIKRCTFVLDGERNIIGKFLDVKASGHAEEVLEFLKALPKG